MGYSFCLFEERSWEKTRMALCVLSLQNYGENLCMRAIRNGASRAGKSCSALLGLRTALCEKRTETTLLLYKSWLFSQNEWGKWTLANFITWKKKREKKKPSGHTIKCLLTDLGPNIFLPGPPTQSISTYYDLSCQYFSTDVMAKLSIRVRRQMRCSLKSKFI